MRSPHDRITEGRASRDGFVVKPSTNSPQTAAKAVFLGTENPDAARIYHRLGWRKIANSTDYVNVTTGDSPEEYLADYFRTPSSVNIVTGDASLSVPMIPLLLTPHDWQVLDGNLPTPMISTRYAEQNSCMGLMSQVLLSRQARRCRVVRGEDERRRLVGISTAWIDADGVCYVDGFIHARFSDSYTAR